MQLCCAMLAKYAEALPDGSVTIFGGGIEAMHIPEGFPAVLPIPFYYVAKVSVPVEASGLTCLARIEFTGPAGFREPLEQTLNIFPPLGGHRASINLFMVLAGVTFPVPGIYIIALSIDGTEIARTEILVH